MSVVHDTRRRRDVPDLLIRGLSHEAVDRLKRQAAANGRSMQSEAKEILESGIRPTMTEWLDRVGRTRAQIEETQGALPGSSANVLEELRRERER